MNASEKGPIQVRLYLHTGYVGGSSEETVEIDRAEWDAMTPAERNELLDAQAETLMANQIDYGWHIEDADDYAATEAGA